jgi:hypothetical protein
MRASYGTSSVPYFIWRGAHGTGPSTRWHLAGCLPDGEGLWLLNDKKEDVVTSKNVSPFSLDTLETGEEAL